MVRVLPGQDKPVYNVNALAIYFLVSAKKISSIDSEFINQRIISLITFLKKIKKSMEVGFIQDPIKVNGLMVFIQVLFWNHWLLLTRKDIMNEVKEVLESWIRFLPF